MCRVGLRMDHDLEGALGQKVAGLQQGSSSGAPAGLPSSRVDSLALVMGDDGAALLEAYNREHRRRIGGDCYTQLIGMDSK